LTGYVTTDVTVNITIPKQSDPVPVRSVFGWITIHQHLGYSFHWDRNWGDYKDGFGSIDANFWLGLEKMHLLTKSQPYRLRVEVQDRSTNLWYSAEYWSFKIGDGSSKYQLEVAGYSGDAGDSLQYEGDYQNDGRLRHYYHNGMKFTTNDEDNDLWPGGNCITTHGGGWWYNWCTSACLTCVQYYYFWFSDTLVVNSRMMIKPQ